MERFSGQVPRTFEELESLPGVGHKTASVVMSQCFGHPAFAVDTHVHRLSTRWGTSMSQHHELQLSHRTLMLGAVSFVLPELWQDYQKAKTLIEFSAIRKEERRVGKEKDR